MALLNPVNCNNQYLNIALNRGPWLYFSKQICRFVSIQQLFFRETTIEVTIQFTRTHSNESTPNGQDVGVQPLCLKLT